MFERLSDMEEETLNGRVLLGGEAEQAIALPPRPRSPENDKAIAADLAGENDGEPGSSCVASDKGKENAQDEGTSPGDPVLSIRRGRCVRVQAEFADFAPAGCRLVSLPPELIGSILCCLSVVDVLAVSATCRALYGLATADHVWQALVQENVPGVRVTSPYPFKSFHALYEAHDPRWFLPKYKVWFADLGLAGRLIIARYDQRRGCIEGYQLVAVNTRNAEQWWLADERVTIRDFEPKVMLHLDKPTLHLPASLPGHITQEKHRVGSIEVLNLHRPQDGGSGSQTGATNPGSSWFGSSMERGNRFRSGVDMYRSDGNDVICSIFMLARHWDENVTRRMSNPCFPYRGMWPPPTIPAPHRVRGVNPYGTEQWSRLEIDDDSPSCREHASDRCFRIGTLVDLFSARAPGWPYAIVRDVMPAPLHFGGELVTYATLDPHLYTPTPDKPYRGIWVGDYSGHGCEFVLLHQPDDDPADPLDPESFAREESESIEQFERRKADAKIYRGRLVAIKLTGDPHVPRGEFTFVVEDLGKAGLIKVMEEPPFVGARVVRSKGHVAGEGFTSGKVLSVPVLIQSCGF